MRRTLPFLTFLPLAFLASGCINALHEASQPTDVKLRMQAPQPQQHMVRVALEKSVDYPVASDGQVEFTVPAFHHGCDMYLFGVVRVRDGAPENIRIIEVRRDGRVIRRLSLTQIAKLGKDEAGYGIVKITD